MAGKVLLDLIFYHLLCVVKCRFMYYLVLWSAIGRQFVFGDPKDKDRYPIKFDEPEHYDARLKAVL